MPTTECGAMATSGVTMNCNSAILFKTTDGEPTFAPHAHLGRSATLSRRRLQRALRFRPNVPRMWP
jgi:hypothetical protein